MDWREYVEQKPAVLAGKPCIKGTRISVEIILERLGAGWTETEIYESLPTLPPGAIQAACLFAARTLSLRRDILGCV